MKDKPVGICLVGVGKFGKKLLNRLEKFPDYYTVNHLYHPDREKAACYGPRGTSDLNRILDDQETEAFVIATPNDQHFDFLCKILSVGRHHAFVEKPITAYYSEA